MKFIDIERDQWEQLRPYLDTCLLPVTGLTGAEAPWEATNKLERLRDAMDHIEIPFKGRVVTYPAFHYTYGTESLQAIESACLALKETAQFRYVIVITAGEALDGANIPGADLLIRVSPEELAGNGSELSGRIGQSIRTMWSAGAD